MIHVRALLRTGISLTTVRRCGAQLHPTAADWFTIDRGDSLSLDVALGLYVLHYLVRDNILDEPHAVAALQVARKQLKLFAKRFKEALETESGLWLLSLEIIDRRWVRMSPSDGSCFDMQEHALHDEYPPTAKLPVYVQAVQIAPLALELWNEESSHAADRSQPPVS